MQPRVALFDGTDAVGPTLPRRVGLGSVASLDGPELAVDGDYSPTGI